MFNHEKTYASRITALHGKVSQLSSPEKAKEVTEFLRGASRIDDDQHSFLTGVERMAENELTEFIQEIPGASRDLRTKFPATSTYNSFQNVEAKGRSKVQKWTGNGYEEIPVSEEATKKLPFAGQINVGGPKHGVIGNVSVVDSNVNIRNNSIVWNGEEFKR